MRNQRGSVPMLMVLMVAAAMAALVPTLYGMIREALNRQSERQRYENLLTLVKSVKQQVEDPFTCPIILAGQRINPALNARRAVSLNYYFATSPDRVEAGWIYNPLNIRLSTVEVRTTGAKLPWDPRYVTGGVVQTLRTFPVRLYLNPENVRVSMIDSTDTSLIMRPETVPIMKNSEFMIQLLVNVNTNDEIQNCYGLNSVASSCHALGGVYRVNPGSIGMHCQPDRICFTKADGLVTNAATCSPYAARAVGRNSSNQMEYICSLCHSDLLTIL